MKLNNEIRKRRERLCLSQEELGAASGFSQQEISYIELGQRKRFTMEELSRLAKALKITVTTLLKAAGE